MKRFLVGVAVAAGLMSQMAISHAATLGSFIQSNTAQKAWFTDGGAGLSSLGTNPSPMDIMWTFQAPNTCAGVGTTVPAKLVISAVDAGPYNAGLKTQPLANFAFSVTNVAGTVNYLSGTAPLGNLTQFSDGGASLNVGFNPQGLMMTSDCYTLDGLNDITQNFSLSFTSASPLKFDDINLNGILDSTNFNVTGLASAAVPEPGAVAMLFGAGIGGSLLALRRRRVSK